MSLNNRANIILVGFMASGKSRVGEMLAKRLGYDLFDIDAMIEREQHQSIKDIFAKHGEWHFRKLEAETIKSLRHREHAVIVTGGGAPICFDNAQVLQQIGQIFYLDASLALVLQRLERSDSRPLGALRSIHDLEKIQALYVYRRPIYLSLGLLIDVNHENKAKTCDEIIDRFKAGNRLTKISKTRVHGVLGHYHIFHENHALGAIDDIRLFLGLKDHRPVIVTTESLKNVLANTLTKIRQTLSSDVPIITFGDGELYKNIDSIRELLDQMFALGLMRKTLVIAVGGGNVGDVAGFLSAIYLRGVPFIQIPTTLLAMVDASIGGKTGIDLDVGKNLVGAFHNPRAVIIDPTLLATLPIADFAAGMAEVIKHAIIADRELFYAIKNDEIELTHMIERALKVKALVVLADPLEQNIRAHLNLGHTFGHAIEKVSGYQIKHGEAVAIGLMESAKLAQSLGILEENFIEDLEAILRKFNLPTAIPEHLKKSDIIAAMKFDKKRDDAGLRFILPKKIGEVIIQHVDENDIW